MTFPKPPAYRRLPGVLAGRPRPGLRHLRRRRCGVAACDIYVLALDDQLRPRAEARRLTRQACWIQGVAWTRDGRSIVYGVNRPDLPVARARRRKRSSGARGAGRPQASALAVDRARPGPSRVHPAVSGTSTSTACGSARLRRAVIESTSTTCIRSTRRTAGGSPSNRADRARGRDLAGRRRRIESHAPHARPGRWPGIAALVAGRAHDRFRLARRRTGSATSGRSASTARACARSRAIPPTRTCRAGRATAAGSTSARTVRAAPRSGALRPRAERKSR